jgi:hypothetical protein
MQWPSHCGDPLMAHLGGVGKPWKPLTKAWKRGALKMRT